jgi:hypothetical protein
MTTDNEKTAQPPVFDSESARQFCGDLAQTVDSLIEVLNEEARLIRAARLTAAAEISGLKATVSERYTRAHGVLKSAAAELKRLAPDEVDHLRERHSALESAISLNLAVLATARTVSETLIRDIADTVTAQRGGRQDIYGADARQTATAPATGPVSYNIAL